MKHRLFLFVLITLCSLYFLISGQQLFKSAQADSAISATLLIEAVHYDGYSLWDADEAVAVRNMSEQVVDLGSWRLRDSNDSESEIPLGTLIQPLQLAWLTGDTAAFQQHFGFPADVVLEDWPGFANDGDEVALLDSNDQLIDVVVYGDEDTAIADWIGSAVQPYTLPSVFGKEGQILFRKPDPTTGLPFPDSDSAADWVQEYGDAYQGRRVRYPGWDIDAFFFPVRDERPASLTIAIAPDNAFETLLETINNAENSLEIATLTFENLSIANALVDAALRGVSTKILLEGSPVGGIADQEKALCQKIETAGGQCWFMISDQDNRIFDRYQFAHAKYMIVDGERALVSSENLSPNSMPYDNKNDGTWGRRGVVLITDAPKIVERLEQIFAHDLDPANHQDLFRWQADHEKYGAPPPGFTPIQSSGGITYTVRFPQAVTFPNVAAFELQQAPENLLRFDDGILGLIGRAQKGDTLLIQQLQERPHWGPTASNRADDPNLRLEYFISAARCGATVRILLDSFFDEADSPVSNAATCALLNGLAREENLHLQCRQANPTGQGIHNKMILAHIDGQGYIQVGSWNGTELASKGNREVALFAQSDAAYEYLANMFETDWPHDYFLPAIVGNFDGIADHALISEVLYDPYGLDETEFVEIVNPTLEPIDLSLYSLGDAVSREDFEDVRRFPSNTIIRSGEVIVVTTSAVDFFETYHQWPNFEILESTDEIPNLIDDPSWGDTDAFFRLGNEGDEVILRNEFDDIVDLVSYGNSDYPDQVPCPLLTSTNHSLERLPYWRDFDNCPVDFREWPFPSPGKTP
ncbi:MAG: phospholipase D-like domain-containing protein [Candidatus Promineifilaceae bacterium]